MKNGFTLFELLIALAVSSIVAMGIFSMFSAVSGIRDASITQSENTLITEALTNLINKDTRMMINNTLNVDKSTGITKLIMTTHNSLRFNKAVPAEVSYYIEDNWLMRRESNSELLYDMEMKIMPNVTDLKAEFYTGSQYQEEVVRNAKIFKVTFTVNDSPIKILAARTVDNVR